LKILNRRHTRRQELLEGRTTIAAKNDYWTMYITDVLAMEIEFFWTNGGETFP